MSILDQIIIKTIYDKPDKDWDYNLRRKCEK